MSDFPSPTCMPGSSAARLEPEALRARLAHLAGWQLVAEGTAIERSFRFDNYWQTMAFVNSVAWVAHAEDHHPDMSVHWGRCVVRFVTLDAGGVTENDFICAEKVSRIVSG